MVLIVSPEHSQEACSSDIPLIIPYIGATDPVTSNATRKIKLQVITAASILIEIYMYNPTFYPKSICTLRHADIVDTEFTISVVPIAAISR